MKVYELMSLLSQAEAGTEVTAAVCLNPSVMISIKPEWCELIASGRKTIEVRKTRPKLEAPFKCYIYCTKADQRLIDIIRDGDENYGEIYHGKPVFIKTEKGSVCNMYGKRQKVIGEFVCDYILEITPDTYGHHEYFISNDDLNASCLTTNDLWEYGGGKKLYGWHISDLVIYDEPKELSRFYKEDFHEALSNWEDLFSIGLPKGCAVEYPPEPKEEDYILKRPPQSWCYVEEEKE